MTKAVFTFSSSSSFSFQIVSTFRCSSLALFTVIKSGDAFTDHDETNLWRIFVHRKKRFFFFAGFSSFDFYPFVYNFRRNVRRKIFVHISLLNEYGKKYFPR